MAVTISLACTKGGVAKTISSLNLSAALAERGFRTLLCDTDPQGSSTSNLGIECDPAASMYQAMTLQRPIAEVIVSTPFGFDVAPALESLAAAATEIAAAMDNYRLRKVLKPIADDYDFIVIDTPPGAGALQSTALAASNLCVVVTQADLDCLRKVNGTIEKIKALQEDGVNPGLRMLGVLITMDEPRTVATKGLIATVRNDLPLIEPSIPKSTIVREATVAHMPVITYEPNHPVSLAYRALAERVIAESGLERKEGAA
jgi:chromosome partitioning protein